MEKLQFNKMIASRLVNHHIYLSQAEIENFNENAILNILEETLGIEITSVDDFMNYTIKYLNEEITVGTKIHLFQLTNKQQAIVYALNLVPHYKVDLMFDRNVVFIQERYNTNVLDMLVTIGVEIVWNNKFNNVDLGTSNYKIQDVLPQLLMKETLPIDKITPLKCAPNLTVSSTTLNHAGLSGYIKIVDNDKFVNSGITIQNIIDTINSYIFEYRCKITIKESLFGFCNKVFEADMACGFKKEMNQTIINVVASNLKNKLGFTANYWSTALTIQQQKYLNLYGN